MIDSNPYGWAGTLLSFLNLSRDSFIQNLTEHYRVCMNMNPDQNQKSAWVNCFESLSNHLPDLFQFENESKDWTIVFEYELPRERGRRPDVIILAGAQIFVIEYKDLSRPNRASIDQISAYARDICHYHAASHGRVVFPILNLTKGLALNDSDDEVYIISPDTLPITINHLATPSIGEVIDPQTWLNSDYAPLPSLVSAARSIFLHEPLPYIKRAESAGIPQTIETLVSIAKYAQENSQHHLALVTGVPGAGKTLVGLQFVYENYFNDQESERTAVFLSGNDPLVEVLRDALDSKVFVQDVHGFLQRYGGHRKNIPDEYIYVFDEAQRAWDSARVREKRHHDNSEPLDFLQIGEKKSWSMMLGLIGDGQEIHIGEESGLVQWNDAISEMKLPWEVHCPNHISQLFTSASKININKSLNLSASLRSHLAEHVQTWVGNLLNEKLDPARKLIPDIQQQGFDMYITRDFDIAKKYVNSRYDGLFEKRFGLLASSKANNLQGYGIDNTFQTTRRVKKGPWYNDPPFSPDSCCQLNDVVTEFGCQGLELDFPIICWGDDLIWKNSRWYSRPPGPRSKARDPHNLRLNSYRVLLTRGRDGFVIFIPPDSNMDSTNKILKDAGIIQLD